MEQEICYGSVLDAFEGDDTTVISDFILRECGWYDNECGYEETFQKIQDHLDATGYEGVDLGADILACLISVIVHALPVGMVLERMYDIKEPGARATLETLKSHFKAADVLNPSFVPRVDLHPATPTE